MHKLLKVREISNIETKTYFIVFLLDTYYENLLKTFKFHFMQFQITLIFSNHTDLISFTFHFQAFTKVVIFCIFPIFFIMQKLYIQAFLKAI